MMAVSARLSPSGTRRPPWDLRRVQLAVSLVGIALLAIIAVFTPWIAPYDPLQQFISDTGFGPPSGRHVMGTDQVGRDVFSRVLYGVRLSLMISFAVLLISLVIGLTVGAVSGLLGSVVDDVLMRITDIFFAIPNLILAMTIIATLGRGVDSLIVALGVIWWPSYARLVRGQVLSIRERPFVEAARVVGNGPVGLITKHILPHTFRELAVRMTLDVGNIILIVSGLSFLGLGAQPPTSEWGAIIGEGRPYSLAAPWLMFFPGVAIVYTILCFSMLGDALQDVLHSGRVRQ